MKVASDDDSPVFGHVVKSAYTAGLAAKKGSLYAKDSIDFVLVVYNPLVEDEDELETWGFEAKGRVTSRTAIEEEESISSLLCNKHIRINESEAIEFIRKESERFQVLQHAYVYDFETVAIAISDTQSEIIRSVIIDFSKEI